MFTCSTRSWQILVAAATAFLISCGEAKHINEEAIPALAPHATLASDTAEVVQNTTVMETIALDKETERRSVLSRPQVPILCYHQIRDWRASDSKQAKDYIVQVARFEEHLKMLADSGYQTILPDQLLAYLTTGAPLPEKPIMLTFDDTNLDQFTAAAPALEKHGFRGVFFVMTVSLGRPRYMTRTQIKELSDRGHAIGSHTWDHQNVKKLKSEDWEIQVEKPKLTLEEITGKPITYFAYPFGLWNKEAIPELQSRGITAAFQLSNRMDAADPLYTIRRNIASGYWSASTLHKKMAESYDLKTTPAASPPQLAGHAPAL